MVNREFSPRDPCVVIIESPNVSVFPGCFQSLMNVESQGYVYGNNEVGNSCLPGGKTHFCPQRLQSKPLTTVTEVSTAGCRVYKTIVFLNQIIQINIIFVSNYFH